MNAQFGRSQMLPRQSFSSTLSKVLTWLKGQRKPTSLYWPRPGTSLGPLSETNCGQSMWESVKKSFLISLQGYLSWAFKFWSSVSWATPKTESLCGSCKLKWQCLLGWNVHTSYACLYLLPGHSSLWRVDSFYRWWIYPISMWWEQQSFYFQLWLSLKPDSSLWMNTIHYDFFHSPTK